MIRTQIIDTNNIGLWCQIMGNPKHPAVLLIMGAGGQGILWRDKFCHKLVESGFCVIRYDSRDTGKSTNFDYNIHPYTLVDLADDAIGILDALGIKKAHIVGISMGGYVAQLMAMYYPDTVKSLTLISSTINSKSLRNPESEPKLSGHCEVAVKKIKDVYKNVKNDRNDKIDAITNLWRVFNGDKSRFPYTEWNHLAEISYDRTSNFNSMINHRRATRAVAADRTKEMSELKLPTLIIHGGADRIIQVDHAKYSNKYINNSDLFIIDEMGHLLTSTFDEPIISKFVKWNKNI